MKYLYKIAVIYIILTIFSCEKSPPCCVNIDTEIDMLFEDRNNVDLLDPSVVNTLNTSQVKIFYIDGSLKKEIYDATKEYQRNFKILNEGGHWFMRLFPNDNNTKGYTTTLIEWNTQDVDTIKCKITKKQTSLKCDTVWYNGALTFPNSDFNSRKFKVIK